jgi:hypothetical protein
LYFNSEIHLDPVTHSEIYAEYVLDMAHTQQISIAVAESTFNNIWFKCLPHVKIRKYKVLIFYLNHFYFCNSILYRHALVNA